MFKPYAGVSTAILFFTKTNSGGTDDVWFYDVRADGFSLDDKRTPLLPAGKLGVDPPRRSPAPGLVCILCVWPGGTSACPTTSTSRRAERG